MKATDFNKEPWKHPVVWSAHIVRKSMDFPLGGPVSVATCECGWINRVKVADRGGAHILAQDDASVAHWLAVIAESGGVAA